MDRRIIAGCASVWILCWSQSITRAGEPSRVSGRVLEQTSPGRLRDSARQDVQWMTDLHAAHRESIRLNRPVLIVFGAEWCHFCTKLEQESLGHPQIAHYINQAYIPLHLDFDQAKREARILNVTAVPCVVALTPQADLVGRLDGFAAPQKVGEMLTKAMRLQTQIQQARYEEATRANSNTMTTAR